MCYPLVVLDRPLAFFPLSCEASTPATAPRTSTTTALLVKLCVEEFAKSHRWQCNYEASAESKTASVIRKQCGNEQDPGRHAGCLVPFPPHHAGDVAELPPSVPLPVCSDGPPRASSVRPTAKQTSARRTRPAWNRFIQMWYADSLGVRGHSNLSYRGTAVVSVTAGRFTRHLPALTLSREHYVSTAHLEDISCQ